MRILYVVPGMMAFDDAGKREMERRRVILQEHASPGVEVAIDDMEIGPRSIESFYEEYLCIPQVMNRVIKAEKEGYDAAIVGCFGDPGLDGCRELVRMPVLGPGMSSLLFAAMLGYKFGVISVMDSTIPTIHHLAASAGVGDKLGPVLSSNIPVLELASNPEATMARLIETGKDLVRAGADTLVLGCMSMAFMMVAEKLQQALDVPVINPALVALKAAESLAASGLSHSKKAYPLPPKLAAELSRG